MAKIPMRVFPPLYSVREAVFKCKSCGAYNAVAQ
jgi:hypothetical protein